MRLLRASKLQVTTGVYGLLYLAFVGLASIPSTRSLIIEGNWKPPDSVGLELVLTQLLFLLFLAGFTASWWSELTAGTILVFWYVLVCCMDVWSSRHGGGGMGPLLGLPGLILGIGFMASWFKKRTPSPRSAGPHFHTP